jgi:hypothetical protein
MHDQPERALNPRLRRADWRFLLPTPRVRRALCDATDPLAEAVAHVADEVVTTAAAGSCELAVAGNPNPAALARLHDALAPGGTCYTEWQAPVGGARQVEAALKAAGFAEVTCYRCWPAPPALPVYWIPVGARGAAAYVRARRRLPGGRLRRLLAAARQRGRELLKGRWANPICAVARRPSPLGGPADSAAWLRGGWPEWNLGRTPDRLSTLLVTGGPRTVSKVVLLAFREPSPTPLVAVKAPRVDAAAAGIRREGAALARLTGPGSRSVPGVPRLLFCREVDGVPLVGETALSGRPLDTLLTPRTLAGWSAKVTDWLASLGRSAPVRRGARWRETLVEPILADFERAFGEVVDRGLLRDAEVIVRGIGDLPQVPEQRDFGPWNLLATPGGELAVLDWESAEVDGLPALDLLYYLAYASFFADAARDRESRIRSYRRHLDPATPTGAVRDNCVARYCDSLSLDPGRLPPIRVLLWLIHAQSDVRHAAADAGTQAPAEALAQSLFLALWAEEVRHVGRT